MEASSCSMADEIHQNEWNSVDKLPGLSDSDHMASVKRIKSINLLDTSISSILERIDKNSETGEKHRLIVSFRALWSDDLYTDASHDMGGGTKKLKSENPIYLSISVPEETILCEPSALAPGLLWRSLLPILASNATKVFWDGRRLLSYVQRNYEVALRSQTDGSGLRDVQIDSLFSNCIVVSLSLIIKNLYIDSDPIRVKRKIMRLPPKLSFLPNHPDPIKRLTLQSHALLLSGQDLFQLDQCDKASWQKIVESSAIFLRASKNARLSPLPYVPLDVFSAYTQQVGSSHNLFTQEKKFQRFTVRCVDCERVVHTSLTDPVGVTVHKFSKEQCTKAKSPGNLYAAYRCRVCSEVLRPCSLHKAEGVCPDPECVNVHALVYCPSGEMCCEHELSKSCPYLHRNEGSVHFSNAAMVYGKRKEENEGNGDSSGNDWWSFPRVHLGMPQWGPRSLFDKPQGKVSTDQSCETTNKYPVLYKIPCPDHFCHSAGTKSSMNHHESVINCPFSHEPIPVYIPILVPTNKKHLKSALSVEETSGKSAYFSDLKPEILQSLLQSPSFSLEEFYLYIQNVIFELDKVSDEKVDAQFTGC